MGTELLAHLRRQWMGALALFLVLTGGTAYAANTVFSTDIVNDQVYSADVRNDTLTGGGLAAQDLRSGSVGPAEAAGLGSADIADGALNDEDIGQNTFNFEATIGTVPAHSCVEKTVTGVNAKGDHLLLTPNANTANLGLSYSGEYDAVGNSAYIIVCNHASSAIDGETTRFNLLVIDAQ